MSGIVLRRVSKAYGEEQVLENGLDGYAEYKQRVRSKVIPHMW